MTRAVVAMGGWAVLCAAAIWALAAANPTPPAPTVLDCHLPRVQAGVLVKRLSDGKVVRIDVCGAADSSDDTFRYPVEDAK